MGRGGGGGEGVREEVRGGGVSGRAGKSGRGGGS